MDNWKTYSFEEITDNYDSTRVPVKKTDRKPGPFPYYGASGITDYVDSYLFDGEYLLIAEDGENVRSRKTPTVFLVDGKFWVNNHTHIVKANELADSRFLFYYMLHNDLGEFISGSTRPKLTKGSLNQSPVYIPLVPEQKAIAYVLSCLDDKIELLRKQNETLEAIAQTIFKEWFVNFNFPDKNGKPYKDSGGKMIDSELGAIPDGWGVGTYGHIVDVSTGKGLDRRLMSNKGLYSVLGANGSLGKTDEYLLDDDLILTGRVGTLGTVNISHGKVWVSDNVLISRAKQKDSFHFAYFTLKRSHFESLNRGSTQPLITQTDLKNVGVIVPKANDLHFFSRVTKSLFNKISNNSDQVITLTRLRDTLLPKLMSGQVRVKGNWE